MFAKVLTQLIGYLIGALFLSGFIVGTYERWSANIGPSATAVVVNKARYRPRKSVFYTYELRIAFKNLQDSVTTDMKVSRNAYEASNIKGLVAIRYDSSRPQNVVPATETWFQYSSLGILAFGLILIYAAATAKKGKDNRAF